MEKVRLMNRTDRKFWFHSDYLPKLLQEVQHDYHLLCIEGKSLLSYSTAYFDTKNDRMFSAHHNGKLNRFKIRKRTYIDSGIHFLEIKFKNNKGRTIKKRIPCALDNSSFTSTESQFINSHTPFYTKELIPSLLNKFSRLTLVNKNLKERCTIDLDIEFEVANRIVTLDNLVVVEIKSDGKSNVSPLAQALRKNRIKTSGFSKYCIGRCITDPILKRNIFKEKIRTIEKVTQTSIHII
ncbi:polyphosphate polymerase domain-containing protein [Labilibaculum manganireducens]|nr:polyphosphate polymerase domain-containing protein [Labilibaculum manganireducens]